MQLQHLTADFEREKVDVPIGGTLIRNQHDPRQVRAGKTRVHTFVRNEDGHHVCDVIHEGDLRRLLSIREGFAPYGEEAEAEATALYGWSYDRLEPATQARNFDDDPSQPPVVMEVFDDDGELIHDEDVATGDDDDEPQIPEGFVRPALGQLPAVPSANADGSEWMAYVASLPGITNIKDRAARIEQLRDYARTNYGVDLPVRGVLILAKEIGKLQESNA